MANVRTFIAVPLPDELKRHVDSLVAAFRPLADGITWVKAINLHFTLRFLGDIPEESVADLNNRVAGAVAGIAPFNLQLGAVGFFPDSRRPRVIWIDARGDLGSFHRLAAAVESACREAGFGPADKPFAPHLTIGRVKRHDRLEALIEKLKNTSVDSPQFLVDSVITYRSDLSPAGPKYTAMGKALLSG